jgi:predicted nucleic acid-binding protein
LKDFVLDCSVAMSWILPDEYSDYAERILLLLDEQQAVVPSIWYLEITNVLLVSERRGRMTQAQTAQALLLLKSLDIVMDEETETQAFDATFKLGRNQGLASYDAAYLELAIRLNIPLATSDDKLIGAANRCGVVLDF